jgi:hypothetical protein
LGIKNERKLNQKIEKLVDVKSLNTLVLDGEIKEFAHVPNKLEHVS